MGKKLIYLLAASTLIALSIAGAMTVRTIYQADGVAEPVTVTIQSDDNTINFSNTTATRLSRGGAQFGMEATSDTSWTSYDWVRDIQINIPVALEKTPIFLTVVVGADEYLIDNIAVLPRTIDANTVTLTITKETLERPSIFMPFFGSILNWPGDFTAIVRALTQNLILILFLSVASIFLLTSYYKLTLRPGAIPENKLLKKQLGTLTALLALMLSVLSLVLFITHSPTAYTWPTLDMGPYFERAQDPNFLPNDFYTNVSSAPSPRMIFGTIITKTASIFGMSWYESLFWYRTIFVILLPPLLLLTFMSFFRTRSIIDQLKISAIISVGIALALIPTYIDQFTIALWRPFDTAVTPHVMSFFVGMIAVYLSNSRPILPSLPIWFAASIIHPAIGLSMVVFYCILTWHTHKKQLLLIIGAGALFPLTFLYILFGAENPLSAFQFVYYYITISHPFHYLPSQFESAPLSPFPWFVHALLISILFLGLSFVGWWQKQRWVTQTSILALFSYLGAIIVSYLFIELWPVKIVAVLGPSRYTLFGYWLILILAASLLSRIPVRYFLPQLLLTITKIFDFRFTQHIVTGTLVLLIIGTGTHFIDNPQRSWQQDHPELVKWTASTEPDSFFAANSNTFFGHIVNTTLVSKRSVLSGNGFPFREDDFAEFDARRALLYGDLAAWKHIPGASTHIKSNVYFRSLTPKDFLRINNTYQLDYVIIEPMFAAAFDEYTPVFQDEDVLIYSVASFSQPLNI